MSQLKNNLILRRLIAVLLICVLAVGILPGFSFAAGENNNDEYIELDGTFTGRFDLSSSKTHLFQLTNIAPGDSWSGTIHVKNSGSDRMEIAVVSVTSNLDDTLLFDALVTYMGLNGEPIYSGPYGFESDNEYMTEFHTVDPGETIGIDVTVMFPKSCGNEMMGKEMDSTWTFEARYYYSPPPQADYIVRYVDTDGNELLDSKHGRALIDSTVTETAPVIDGYTVDEEVKSIVIKRTDNEIVFVYERVEEPVPSSPEPSDTPGGLPGTGYDDVSGLSDSAVWLWVVGLTIACCVIIYLHIVAARRRLRELEKQKKK